MDSQLDATIIILLIISNGSTCFGRYFRPSSGALDCVYSLCLPHPGHHQASSSVLYTTSCKHSLVRLMMGESIARNMLSRLKLLIKLLLLHLVGCLYYYSCRTVSVKRNRCIWHKTCVWATRYPNQWRGTIDQSSTRNSQWRNVTACRSESNSTHRLQQHTD